MAKLVDFDEQALLESENPFALAVLAHLKAKQTRYKTRTEQRAHWKKTDLTLAFNRGYQTKEVRALLQFIDWVMILPGCN